MDLTHYNVIVKQVEGCSDILRDVQGRCLKAGVGDDRIGAVVLRELADAITDLDRRALQMLAYYDPAAKGMLAEGISYDHRRDLFKKLVNRWADKGPVQLPEPAPAAASSQKPPRRRHRFDAKNKARETSSI